MDEELGGLQSKVLQRVRHSWSDLAQHTAQSLHKVLTNQQKNVIITCIILTLRELLTLFVRCL